MKVTHGNETRQFKSLAEICRAYGLNQSTMRSKKKRAGLPDKMTVTVQMEIEFKEVEK